MHAISNNIFYIDHMKNAGVPVSPSQICKLANNTLFLGMGDLWAAISNIPLTVRRFAKS